LISRGRNIVVIGNGMVGHRFIEKCIEHCSNTSTKIITFCEEARAAYDRVGLTSLFAHRDAEKLMLARRSWYEEHGVEIHIGDRCTSIDRAKKQVISERGLSVPYDDLVIATGSFPFVPPVPGIKNRGVYVYRTIQDVEQIIAASKTSRRCVVIGGGLLGLEAAKAAFDLGLETHVVEFANRLMPRQIDDAGSAILVKKIEALGVKVHLGVATKKVLGESTVEGIEFTNGTTMECDMLIVSAGIRPRDELAREAGIQVGERGGIVVDDRLQTSEPHIYAIGEVALHRGSLYGLVAPGYEMAEIAALNLTGGDRRFSGSDLSTKLKLMGVDVASFGSYELGPDAAESMVHEDRFQGVYKKLFFDKQGDKLLGGILVGDSSDYGALSILAKSGDKLPGTPSQLLGFGAKLDVGIDSMSGSAQVCSCNNVSKDAICQAIADKGLKSIADVKTCTRAGTGCGGCMPLVTDIFKSEMKKAGVALTNHLCEHFAYSRQQLFDIIKIKELKSFDAVLHSHGKGYGCEICKPAVASILASLWNECILESKHETLQDSNDRYLANIQRGGSYSVVPRVAGGEITPEKLIALGTVAKKYKLYCKITGGQRIDLFGAQLHELPSIWKELVDAGFESGHAYGKALRTVKSCVGTTWCRFGVQDSVGFAIRVEERYRGIRAPHKMKMAVSGCVRECAEAQSKDFGLIATEHGYNLYICGNGGAKPRHADLFATDLDEATAIKYIDRVMMYYIFTADRLTRTSVWMENYAGGLEELKQVIIEDKLGICEELERRMQHLVDSYQCEWAEVVNDPEKQKRFRQFVNSGETEATIEFVDQRGQWRPADWPKGGVPLVQLTGTMNASSALASESTLSQDEPDTKRWVRVGAMDDFPIDGGSTVKVGKSQIAVYNFASRGEWYACQNMCPHMNAFVLARGIIGNAGDEPKVACPLHKKNFSLQSGKCLSGDPLSVNVFPVKVERGEVYLLLPPEEELNELLATDKHCITATK
jgi:nitrite reductase (NADH) large subunit